MRNEMTSCTSGNRIKRGCALLALAALSSLPLTSHAFVDIEVVLDGYAYTVNSDVAINLGQGTIIIPDSSLENCERPNALIPLNTAYLTLITNNQDIGIDQFKYSVQSRLMFLTSETSNVVCDNGLFVDQIFGQGFEQPISPFLIFGSGFEN